MQKRALAIWPLAVKLRANDTEVKVELQNSEQWNQEIEKLRNEQREWETAQEKIDRLIPGLELKRIVL